MKTLIAAASMFFLTSLAHAAPLGTTTSPLEGAGGSSSFPQRMSAQGLDWGERATRVVMSAMSKLDTPYRLGGSSIETGFDCSGLVHAVYKQTLGLVLPRRAAEQAASTERIDKSQLRPGDLVFFNTLRRQYSHVGIYIGDNKFIHAPRTGARVRVENMDIKYWRTRFDGARRVSLADAGNTPPRLSSAFASQEPSSNYQLNTASSNRYEADLMSMVPASELTPISNPASPLPQHALNTPVQLQGSSSLSTQTASVSSVDALEHHIAVLSRAEAAQLQHTAALAPASLSLADTRLAAAPTKSTSASRDSKPKPSASNAKKTSVAAGQKTAKGNKARTQAPKGSSAKAHTAKTKPSSKREKSAGNTKVKSNTKRS